MKLSGFLFILFCLLACQPRVNQTKVTDDRYSQLRKTDWLIGSWCRKSANGVLTESWQLLNDTTYTGRSFFVSNGDTVSSESIRMECRNGKWYYIPTVSGQNEGKAIVFTQTEQTDSTFIFENPQHDFPQVISYRFQKPDSLIAEISAMVNGERKSIVFRMVKVK